MAHFVCSVCSKTFNIPDEVLAKYPNWTPKYCREHSPKKGVKTGGVTTQKKYPSTSITSSIDLKPEEVLQKIAPAGPDSGIFTDGSARPNPGRGGWGVVWVQGGEIVAEKSGNDLETTNNRMELTALIEAFKLLPEDSEETIYSDSNLCVNTLTQWAQGWEKLGWKRKTGAIENLDLVKEAYTLMKQHPKVKLEWIKAHSGWLWNEYANALAISWIWQKDQ